MIFFFYFSFLLTCQNYFLFSLFLLSFQVSLNFIKFFIFFQFVQFCSVNFNLEFSTNASSKYIYYNIIINTVNYFK